MSAIHIPKRFLKIPYDGKQHPGCSHPKPLVDGANCQRFAYELLRHFSYEIADFRSSDLWDDVTWTFRAKRLQPLDILLFNKTCVAYGAHVGIYVGDNQVIHLAKHVGIPAIWSLEEFAKDIRYKMLIGAKRVRSRYRRAGTAPLITGR